jgi:hypothetical protein
MHQQLWGYKVEWKSVSRGTGGKKVEYHCHKASRLFFATLSNYRLFNEYEVSRSPRAAKAAITMITVAMFSLCPCCGGLLFTYRDMNNQ